jgi:hypothetical protein
LLCDIKSVKHTRAESVAAGEREERCRKVLGAMGCIENIEWCLFLYAPCRRVSGNEADGTDEMTMSFNRSRSQAPLGNAVSEALHRDVIRNGVSQNPCFQTEFGNEIKGESDEKLSVTL